jgi:hypothetical protein
MRESEMVSRDSPLFSLKRTMAKGKRNLREESKVYLKKAIKNFIISSSYKHISFF